MSVTGTLDSLDRDAQQLQDRIQAQRDSMKRGWLLEHSRPTGAQTPVAPAIMVRTVPKSELFQCCSQLVVKLKASRQTLICTGPGTFDTKDYPGFVHMALAALTSQGLITKVISCTSTDLLKMAGVGADKLCEPWVTRPSGTGPCPIAIKSAVQSAAECDLVLALGSDLKDCPLQLFEAIQGIPKRGGHIVVCTEGASLLDTKATWKFPQAPLDLLIHVMCILKQPVAAFSIPVSVRISCERQDTEYAVRLEVSFANDNRASLLSLVSINSQCSATGTSFNLQLPRLYFKCPMLSQQNLTLHFRSDVVSRQDKSKPLDVTVAHTLTDGETKLYSWEFTPDNFSWTLLSEEVA
uniref:Uncharacterized protein n=1 Tax=Eutreptiella gymnastica TaxID=73025 RepID=A0A6U7WW74_9EUGL|mmetsp:Transcript_137658/g.239334  ORF Transcript_137658/g.239334 Transcript_137658/m.239334 type:complete len:352 (+) Transcript_137658:152-1207(+)